MEALTYTVIQIRFFEPYDDHHQNF